MEPNTELLNAPAVDRAVLAVTDLQVRWERAGREFTDEMIADVARSWSIVDSETGQLETFLCEFVMEMREDADEDDY